MPPIDELESLCMARALELAARGRGFVEPNPLVGCVITRGGHVVGEGWHRKYGGPHAEVEALAIAGEKVRGGTAFVTLEPCAHHGKTPPCVDALIAAGIARVVCAQADPFPQVAGRGIEQLRAAGIAVEVGLMESAARHLNAPYLKLVTTGLPWVIAKWAMTLDGKIATATGDSQWISGEASRQIVHELRGRMDAIIIGRGTAERDDPLLTARPPGARTALRVVVDSAARLSPQSQLVRTARELPVLVACTHAAPRERVEQLQAAGCEVYLSEPGCPHPGEDEANRVAGVGAYSRNPGSGRVVANPRGFAAEGLVAANTNTGGSSPGHPTHRTEDSPAPRVLLAELGRRRFTNVLIEGGSQLLGSFFDAAAIDEVHAFIAPKLIGGAAAPSPLGGSGVEKMSAALSLENPTLRHVGDDWYISGRCSRG